MSSGGNMKGRKLLLPLELKNWHAGVKKLLVEIRGSSKAEVHILHVLTPPEWGFLTREEYDTEEKLTVLRSALDEGYMEGLLKTFRRLKEIAGELGLLGFKTKVVLVPGEVEEVVADYAEKHGADFVILSISRDSLSMFRAGKVVDILRAVEKPVIVVKG